MPIHDWTRVTAGTWHDFHLSWISEIRNALNGGLLPPDYYAQAEQVAGPMGPDVLTLQVPESPNGSGEAHGSEGGIAVAVAQPHVRVLQEAEATSYWMKRRKIVIRHASGDRIVALIEIVSPGNKSSASAIRSFVQKAADAIFAGFHLLVIDLFPIGPRDPAGVHALIWAELGEKPFLLTADEPLELAAYAADLTNRAYVEPRAVGQPLIDMPLFLESEIYVNVPLEATYMAAYRGVPKRWKAVLEGAV